MLLAFFFCSIAIDWFSIAVEYVVVVPVVFPDLQWSASQIKGWLVSGWVKKCSKTCLHNK